MRRIALAVLLAALSGAAWPARAANTTVTATDTPTNHYQPPTVAIAPGDTVTWTVEGTTPHTVEADDGSFSSNGNLNPVTPYTRRFDQPGVYRFYCRYHGARGGVGMSGSVTVQPATTTTSAPSTTTTTAKPTTTTARPTTTTTARATTTTASTASTTTTTVAALAATTTSEAASTTSTSEAAASASKRGGSNNGPKVVALLLAIAGLGAGAFAVARRLRTIP
jgi:plastocyanin